MIKRRDFLTGSAAVAAGAISLPALGWAQEKSKLKITNIRLVRLEPRNPPPVYKPAPGSWSTQGVEAIGAAEHLSGIPPDPQLVRRQECAVLHGGNYHRQRHRRLRPGRRRWRLPS